MLSMAGVFSRFRASPQSQESHSHSTTSCPPTPLIDSNTPAHAKTKGAHQKFLHSSTSNVISTKERELSRQLLEKKAEIRELRTYYEDKLSRRDHEMQDLRHGQTILRESSNKDGDMLTFSKGFQLRLDRKGKEINEMRGYYSRTLHAQESQQKNSKTLQRNADAEAEALREKLTTTEQALELCRDDLFRLQPVCRISDGNIIAAFESLGEQLVNWIDNETSAFEKAYPGTPVGCLFSSSEDPDVACFLQLHPLAGEYLCRNLVNRYLLNHMFGANTHLWGLSGKYTHMRLHIEHGMASLRPPRGTGAHISGFLVLCLTVSDSQTINIWRAETMSALGVTQEYKDLKEKQSIQWTKTLFESLSASYPNFFGREKAMKEFHNQVTIPATTIVSQLQGVASPYRLDMVEKDFLDYKPFTKDDLRRVIAIDLETGRTLKPGSAVVSDKEGIIGEFVLPLEPSLHRVNEGMSEIDLRQETWLVRLDHALGSRAPKMTEEGAGTYVLDDL